MQGSGLLGMAITIPGVECVGAADLYDGRHTLAKEITGNPNLPTTRQYKQLLDRKDIDCIVAAVPDHWHRRVVVDACNAGKDIYCEKPMSHNVADGLAMVEASQKNNRIVQIGSQRVSSVLCETARDLYQKGTIGDVEMVELTLGRNDPTGAWQYPPPPDLSPQNLDWDTWLNDAPKIPFNPLHFARWRCWRAYGTGVAGDLMVHLISGMLVTLGWNEIPKSATAMGGIFRFKDGRDMPDFHTVLFDYHGIPVYVRLDLGCETPELARFMGPKGILDAGEFDLQHYFAAGHRYWRRVTTPTASRRRCATLTVKQWHEEHDPQLGKEPSTGDVLQGARLGRHAPPPERVLPGREVAQGRDRERGLRQPCGDRLPHGERVVLPRRKPVTWDEGSKTIKS